MIFRFIVLFAVLLSIQYNGNGQSFKERFDLGVQTEFSFMPSFQHWKTGVDDSFDKPESSRFYEAAFVSNYKLSKRFNFIYSMGYRQLTSFDYTISYNDFGVVVNNQVFHDETNWWYRDYKSHTLSIDLGLNYEIFQFSKFAITLHAVYGKQLMLNHSFDYQYLTTEFRRRDTDNTFRTISEPRPVFRSGVDKFFDSVEFGAGIKFNKFSYEITISNSNGDIISYNSFVGVRVRYMFL